MAYRKDIQRSKSGFAVGKTTEKANLKFQSFLATGAAEMALSWILKDGIVTTVLAGASKTSQIPDNIKAVENTDFSDEEIKKINDIAL